MHALKGKSTFRLSGAPIINDSFDIQPRPFQLFVPMPVLGKKIVGGHENMSSNRRGLRWEEIRLQKTKGTLHSS